jgi:hypothetical protein
MGVDRPDDGDIPPDGPADHRDDEGGGGAGGGGDGRAVRAGGAQPETRHRQEYYAELRVAVSAEQTVTTQQAAAREQAATQKWDGTAKESRWMWTEYQRKWPPEDRPAVNRPADPPGSWRGNRDRYLDNAVNGRAEMECDRIVEREQERISPALRDTESQDPNRYLIGFEHRLKGRDRIKEKVYDNMNEFDLSPGEAASLVPDAIRYTFQYQEARYTQGVLTDVARLEDQGFELDKLKNSWSGDQYKGINSQWIDPDTGQRFEVQFHTSISFEAKQLTHGAYERLRTQQADKFEQMVLEAFQQKVTAEVPVPAAAESIPDFPKRGTDAR